MTTPDSNDAPRWDRWAASVELPEGSNRTTRLVLQTVASYRIEDAAVEADTIAEHCKLARPTVLKHLKLLINAKLVSRLWHRTRWDNPSAPVVYCIAAPRSGDTNPFDEHDGIPRLESEEARRWRLWAQREAKLLEATEATRIVLEAIVNYENILCMTDADTLARDTRMDRETVEQHLAILVSADLLSRKYHRDQRTSFTVYVIKDAWTIRRQFNIQRVQAAAPAPPKPAPTKPRIKRPPSVYHLVADRLDAANADPRLAEVPHDRKLQAIIGVILKHQEALGYQTQARELEQWFDEIVAKRG